jgi:hypothetical protein
LAVLAFLLSFWTMDLWVSLTAVLQQELSSALRSLPLSETEIVSARVRSVDLRELEQTGQSSAGTRKWLRNSSIRVVAKLLELRGEHLAAPRPSGVYEITVTFPNGRDYYLRDGRSPASQVARRCSVS